MTTQKKQPTPPAENQSSISATYAEFNLYARAGDQVITNGNRTKVIRTDWVSSNGTYTPTAVLGPV